MEQTVVTLCRFGARVDFPDALEGESGSDSSRAAWCVQTTLPCVHTNTFSSSAVVFAHHDHDPR